MGRHPYIAIEGVIGVGKTTLARLLKPVLSGEVVLEEFEENPFLSSFYGDRARYAFQTQIFFLLSRYRQQVSRIPAALSRGPVIADYTFEKDRLFARLNLSGDELAVYERVHEALAEQIRRPDLLVYLRADHPVLMGRIAARDRPFERNMDPAYIERLRTAYEEFIAGYSGSSVLVINTNDLNVVQSKEDLAYVIESVKDALEAAHPVNGSGGWLGSAEETLQSIIGELEAKPGHLADFQQFHRSLDADKGFDQDPFFNFVMLSEEIGELARVLKEVRYLQKQLTEEGNNQQEALEAAIVAHRAHIQDELADCLAYLLKLSNYAGIDLEAAYLEKMHVNTRRDWHMPGPNAGEHTEGRT